MSEMSQQSAPPGGDPLDVVPGLGTKDADPVPTGGADGDQPDSSSTPSESEPEPGPPGESDVASQLSATDDELDSDESHGPSDPMPDIAGQH